MHPLGMPTSQMPGVITWGEGGGGEVLIYIYISDRNTKTAFSPERHAPPTSVHVYVTSYKIQDLHSSMLSVIAMYL